MSLSSPLAPRQVAGLASTDFAAPPVSEARARSSDAGAMTPTFQDRHPEIQHLVRGLHMLRAHNLRFKDGDPQDTLLIFAEAALVLIVLERPYAGRRRPRSETLYSLLQRAVSRSLLRLPWEDQEDGIRRVIQVRNTVLHGNYEQVARHAGCATVADYFKTQFAPEVEVMLRVVERLFA